MMCGFKAVDDKYVQCVRVRLHTSTLEYTTTLDYSELCMYMYVHVANISVNIVHVQTNLCIICICIMYQYSEAPGAYVKEATQSTYPVFTEQ